MKYTAVSSMTSSNELRFDAINKLPSLTLSIKVKPKLSDFLFNAKKYDVLFNILSFSSSLGLI